MCPKKLTYLIIFFKSFALALKISDWAVKLLVYNDFGANSSVVAISAPGSGKLRAPFEKYKKASYT